jgi:hypothetical protein
MSMLTKSERITVERFARVPQMLDPSPIERQPPSMSDVSSVQGKSDFSESCLLTRSLKHTHEPIYWVDAAEDEFDVMVRKFFFDVLIVTIFNPLIAGIFSFPGATHRSWWCEVLPRRPFERCIP